MANVPSGIYKIENIIDGKCYIGSAVDIKFRWQCHMSMLNNDKHNNRHLQRAWNKYGAENFRFAIVEICKKNELLEREQFYIDSTNVCQNGYNICPIAGSNLGIKWSDKTKKKMSFGQKGILHTEKTKIKMSIAQKKRRAKYGGTKHTDETKKQISENLKAYYAENGHPLKGRTIPENIRKKMSKAAKNKIISIEHRQNLSRAGLAYWKCKKNELKKGAINE